MKTVRHYRYTSLRAAATVQPSGRRRRLKDRSVGRCSSNKDEQMKTVIKHLYHLLYCKPLAERVNFKRSAARLFISGRLSRRRETWIDPSLGCLRKVLDLNKQWNFVPEREIAVAFENMRLRETESTVQISSRCCKLSALRTWMSVTWLCWRERMLMTSCAAYMMSSFRCTVLVFRLVFHLDSLCAICNLVLRRVVVSLS